MALGHGALPPLMHAESATQRTRRIVANVVILPSLCPSSSQRRFTLLGRQNSADGKLTPEYCNRAAGPWFYGWAMWALATLLMMASSPGQSFGIAFFNSEFRAAFGLSHTSLSTIYLMATLAAAAPLPWLGGIVDRVGLRNACLGGIGLMAATCLLASCVNGPVVLFVALTLLRALGSGLLVLLSTNTLAAWFDRRLGFAVGLLQLVMAASTALIPAGIVLLIGAFTWRGAYVVLAAMIGGGLLPLLAFAYRNQPEDVGQYVDGQSRSTEDDRPTLSEEGLSIEEARRTCAYWILIATTAVWGAVSSGLLFHAETFFEMRGLGASDATRALGYLAVAMATAQGVGGLIADRVAMRWSVAGAMLCLALSTALPATSAAPHFSFAFFGFGQGLLTIMAGTAWATFFGRRHLGRIRGGSIMAGVLGSSVGPMAMGLSIDTTGDFVTALEAFAVVCALLAIAAALWLAPVRRMA